MSIAASDVINYEYVIGEYQYESIERGVTVVLEDGGKMTMLGGFVPYPEYYYGEASRFVVYGELQADFSVGADAVYTVCPNTIFDVNGGQVVLNNANLFFGTECDWHDHSWGSQLWEPRVMVRDGGLLQMDGGTLTVSLFGGDTSYCVVQVCSGELKLDGTIVNAVVDLYYEYLYSENGHSVYGSGQMIANDCSFARTISIYGKYNGESTPALQGSGNSFTCQNLIDIEYYAGNLDDIWNFIANATVADSYVRFAANGEVEVTAAPERLGNVSARLKGIMSTGSVVIEEGAQLVLDTSIYSLTLSGQLTAEFETNADALIGCGSYCRNVYVGGHVDLTRANLNLSGTSCVVSVQDGGSFVMSDATMTLPGGMVVQDGGELVLAKSVASGKVTVRQGAKATITDSVLESLSISLLSDTHIRGNDFSNTQIEITDADAGGVVDLSGNYWGTSQRDVVMARLGDAAEHVYLGELEGEYTGEEIYTVTNTNDSGEGSLRRALELTAAYAGTRRTEIRFAPALAGQTIQLGSDLVITKKTRLVNIEENPVLLAGGTLRVESELHMENMSLDSLVLADSVTLTGTGNVLTGENAVIYVESPDCYLGLLEVSIAHPETAFIQINCDINNSVLGMDALGIPYRVVSDTRMTGSTEIDAGEHLIIDPGVEVDWTAGTLLVSGKLTIANEEQTAALVASSALEMRLEDGASVELIHSDIVLSGGMVDVVGNAVQLEMKRATIEGDMTFQGAGCEWQMTNSSVQGDVEFKYRSGGADSLLSMVGSEITGDLSTCRLNATITDSHIAGDISLERSSLQIYGSRLSGAVQCGYSASLSLTDCEIDGYLVIDYYYTASSLTGSGNVFTGDKLVEVRGDYLSEINDVLEFVSEIRSSSPYVETFVPINIWSDTVLANLSGASSFGYKIGDLQTISDYYGYGEFCCSQVGEDCTLTLEEGVKIIIGEGGCSVSVYVYPEYYYYADEQRDKLAQFAANPDEVMDGYYYGEIYSSCTYNGMLVRGVLQAEYENEQDAVQSDEQYVRLNIGLNGVTSMSSGTLTFKNASIALTGEHSDVIVRAGSSASMQGGRMEATDGWINYGETCMAAMEVKSTIYNESGASLALDGTIHSAGLVLNGAQHADIANTKGITRITITGEAGEFNISGNDFSSTIIDLTGYTGAALDFSGNYWGKVASVADIYEHILGYTEGMVVVTDWLSTPPMSFPRKLAGVLYDMNCEVEGELEAYSLIGSVTIAADNTVTLAERVKWDFGFDHDVTIKGTLLAENTTVEKVLYSLQNRSDILVADGGQLRLVKSGVELPDGCLKVAEGGSLHMEGASLDAAELQVQAGGSATLLGVTVTTDVSVAGELQATGNTFNSYVEINNAAKVTGSQNIFTAAEVFRLSGGFAGNTASLLPLISSVTSAGAYVGLTGEIGTSEFAALSGTLLSGGYRLVSDLVVQENATAVLAAGASWQLNGQLLKVDGTLQASNSGAVVIALQDSDAAGSVQVTAGGSLVLQQSGVKLGKGALTIEEGGALRMTGGSLSAARGISVKQGGSASLDSVQVTSALVNTGTLVLQKSTLASYVELNDSSAVSGSTNIFLGEEVLRLSNFTGNTASLFGLIGATAADAAYIGISGSVRDAAFAAVPAGTLPGGYKLVSDVTVQAGCSVELQSGVSWMLEGYDISINGMVKAGNDTLHTVFGSSEPYANINLKSGGALQLTNSGIDLLRGTVYVNSGASLEMSGGALNATQGGLQVSSGGSVSLKEVELHSSVSVSGTATLTNCDFNGNMVSINASDTTLIEGAMGIGTLSITVGSAPLSIVNNNFENTNIVLKSLDEGEIIDLSGNYWGTTDMEEIISRIYGFREDKVLITSVLSVPPSQGFSLDATMFGLHRISDEATSLVLTFNQAVDAASIRPDSIQLLDSAGNAVVIHSCEVKGAQVILSFDALPHGSYSLKVDGGVKSENGAAFTLPLTDAADVVFHCLSMSGPKVALIRPNTTVTGHFRYVDIFFDQLMDDASLNTDAVHVYDSAGKELAITSMMKAGVQGNIFYRFYVEQSNVAGTYRIVVDSSAENAQGVTMNDAYSHEVYISAPDFSVTGIDCKDGNLGRLTTISYTVENVGDGEAKGSWVDNIFLCPTEVWDESQAVFFGRVTRNNETLAAGESYSGSVTARLEGIHPGEYYVFVKTDMSSSVYEGNEENNVSRVKTQLNVQIEEHAQGDSSFTVTSFNEYIYYSFTAAESGTMMFACDNAYVSSVKITGNKNSIGVENVAIELEDSGKSNHYFDVEAGKTYYIRLRARKKGEITTTLQKTEFEVFSCSTHVLALGRSATINLIGSAFEAGMTAYLLAPDGTRYDADALVVHNGCNAQLSVKLPESVELATSFTLVLERKDGSLYEYAQPLRCVNYSDMVRVYFEQLDGYQYVSRVGWVWSGDVKVANASGNDMDSPIVLITDTNSDFALYYSYDDAKVRDRKALICLAGTDKSSTAVLSAGAVSTIPIYMRSYRASEGSINALALNPGDIAIISDSQWALLESALRPANLTDAEWNAWWGDMQPRIGSRIGDFVAFIHGMQDRAVGSEYDVSSGIPGLVEYIIANHPQYVPTITMRGVFTDMKGGAVANVLLDLYCVQNGERVHLDKVATDSQGRYAIHGLVAGQLYELESSCHFLDEEGAPVSITQFVAQSADFEANLVTSLPDASLQPEYGARLVSDADGNVYRTQMIGRELRLVYSIGGRQYERVLATGDCLSNCQLYWSDINNILIAGWIDGRDKEADVKLRFVRMDGAEASLSEVIHLNNPDWEDRIAEIYSAADGTIYAVTETENDSTTTLVFHKFSPDDEYGWESLSSSVDEEALRESSWDVGGQVTSHEFRLPFFNDVTAKITCETSLSKGVETDKATATVSQVWTFNASRKKGDEIEYSVSGSLTLEQKAFYDCATKAVYVEEPSISGSVTFTVDHKRGLVALLKQFNRPIGSLLTWGIDKAGKFGWQILAGVSASIGAHMSSDHVGLHLGAAAYIGFERKNSKKTPFSIKLETRDVNFDWYYGNDHQGNRFSGSGTIALSFVFDIHWRTKLGSFKVTISAGGSVHMETSGKFDFDGYVDFDISLLDASDALESGVGMTRMAQVEDIIAGVYEYDTYTGGGFAASTQRSAYVYVDDRGGISIQYFDAQSGKADDDIVQIDFESELFGGDTNINYISAETDGLGSVYLAAEGFYMEDEYIQEYLKGELTQSLGDLMNRKHAIETVAIDAAGTARMLNQEAFESFSWNGEIYDVSHETSEVEIHYMDGRLGMIWTSAATGCNQVYVSFLSGDTWASPEVLFSSHEAITGCYINEVGDDFYVTFDIEQILQDGTDTITSFVYTWVGDDWVFQDSLNTERARELYADYQKMSSAPVFSVAEPILEKVGDGQVSFLLTWEGEADYQYELTLDDEVISLGKTNSYKATLKDGSHTYSLKAIAGNGLYSKSEERSVSFDATAPVVSEVMAQYRVLPNGNVELVLTWAAAEDVTSTRVWLDNREYTPQNGNSCVIETTAGSHVYRIEQMDAAGNTGAYTADIDIDSRGPVITMNQPQVVKSKDNPGMCVVTFSWQADTSASYVLKVDDETYELGMATCKELELEDGVHQYVLIATNVVGASTQIGGVVETDATAPELRFAVSSMMPAANKGYTIVTFTWSCSEAANLILRADGKSYDVTGRNTVTLTLEDGPNSASLTAVDAFGNKTSRSVTFKSDNTAPSLRLNKPSVHQLADGGAVIAFSWGASDSSSITYDLYVNGSCVASGLKKKSYSMSMARDVTSWYVVARDKYGNTTTVRDDNRYDMPLAPVHLSGLTAVPQKVAGKDGYISLTLSWSSDAQTSYNVWVNNRLVSTTSSTSFTTQVKDGHYSYRVEVAESGRKGNTLQGSGSFDATAPVLSNVVHEVSSADGESAKVVIKWKLSETSAKVTLSFSNGEVYRNLSGSSYTVTLPTGNYTYTITATDTAGNQSAPISGSLKVDADSASAQMQVPVLTRKSKGETAAYFAWSCNDPDATFVLKVDGHTYNVGSALEYAGVVVKDGPHDYKLIVTRKNGVSTEIGGSFVTDATAPEITLDSKVKLGETRNGAAQVSFSWYCNEEAVYQLLIDDVLVTPEPVSSNFYTCYVKDNTPDHKHTYKVIATDAFGNVAESETEEFYVDATPPVLSDISVEASSCGNSSSVAVIRWVPDEECTVYVSIDGGEPKTMGKYNDSFFVDDLADGRHSYSLYAVDEYGNTSACITGEFETDGTNPEFVNFNAKQQKGKRIVKIEWKFAEACTYMFYADGSWHETSTLSTTGSYTTGTLSPGNYDFTIMAKDKFGNETRIVQEYTVAPIETGKQKPQNTAASFETIYQKDNKHWLASVLDDSHCEQKKEEKKPAKLPHSSISPFDPNDIYGPAGYGAENWIAPQEMQFQIVCENKPEENIAHAAMVTITQKIDTAFDYSSFRLGDMMIAGNFIEVEGDVQSFKERVDWASTLGVWVDVNASFDAETGIVTWEFVAIDPKTGFVVSNPFSGLLAPNYNPPEGDGGVYYYVTPKESTLTGASFSGQASIVFDFNEPILTPTISYTLDKDKPDAVVLELAETNSGQYLHVSWQGSDKGSGVAYYNIFVSVDGGNWQLWQSGISATSALYTVAAGEHTYSFLAQGVDYAGNEEELGETGIVEATTQSTYSPQSSTLSVVAIAAEREGNELTLTIRFSESATCTDWAAALQVLTPAGALDVSTGRFSYDDSSYTLSWLGNVENLAMGELLSLRLHGGLVLDSQGISMGNSIPAFSAPVALGASGSAQAAPAVVDYDGDGLLDLLVGEIANGKGKVRLYLNEGTTEVASYAAFSYLTAENTQPLAVQAEGCQGAIVRMVDITGDGAAELLVGQADGTIRVFTAAENGSWVDAGLLNMTISGKESTLDVGTRAALELADFNGDGRVDLLVGTGDGNLVIFYDTAAEGASAFGVGQYLHDSHGRIKVGSRASVAVADVDGDGLSDMLVGSADGSILFYRNAGSATEPLYATGVSILSADTTLDLSDDTTRVRLDTGDVNGDGLLDIVVGQSDGAVRVLYGADDSTSIGMVLAGESPIYAVENVEVVVSGGIAMVSWDAVEAASYELSYKLAGDTTAKLLRVQSPAATLELPDGTYMISVRAITENGTGAWTAPIPAHVDTIAPLSPSSLECEVAGGAVTLTWAESDTATVYEVRYKLSSASTWFVMPATENNLRIHNLSAAGYDWQVRAVDAAGNKSDWVEGNSFIATEGISKPSTHWANGMIVDSFGNVVGGYHDVDKTGNSDTDMCWAAASSSILAWWQQQYPTGSVVAGVPQDAAAIYACFCENWRNVSGEVRYAFTWWLSGASDNSSYNRYYFNNYQGDSATGAWYADYYNRYNISNHTNLVNLSSMEAGDVASAWEDMYNSGGMLALGVFRSFSGNSLNGGHSLALWGFEEDADGKISQIFVTDSDDAQSTMVTLSVAYDKVSGFYKIDENQGNLSGYYLGTYSYLKAGGITSDADSTEHAAPLTISRSLDDSGTCSANVLNWVGPADAEDYYSISAVGDGTYRVWINTAMLETSVCVSVGALNEQGVFEPLQQLVFAPGAAMDTLPGVAAEQGDTLYIKVESLGSDNTGGFYELNLSATVPTAGNDLATHNNSAADATENLADGSITTGWVGAGDACDFYRVEMTSAGSLSISLDELESAVRVRIYERRDDGSLAQLQSCAVKVSQGVDDILALTSGTYYVEVAAFDRGAGRYNTGYSLTLKQESASMEEQERFANLA